MPVLLAAPLGIIVVASIIAGAAPSSGDPLLDWLKNNASAVGILAFLVIALMRGWLITKREADHTNNECDKLREERDKALDLVYKQAEISTRALDVSERWSGMT